MQPSDFERLVEKFGLPVLFTAALAYVLWKILWLLASRMIVSLDKRDAAAEKQSEFMETLSSNLKTLCKADQHLCKFSECDYRQESSHRKTPGLTDSEKEMLERKRIGKH